jgi:hypothetical protein
LLVYYFLQAIASAKSENLPSESKLEQAAVAEASAVNVWESRKKAMSEKANASASAGGLRCQLNLQHDTRQ